MAKLACLPLSAKLVERITKRIGGERCAERDEAVAAYLALPLVERKAAPAGVTAPTVAVVSTDGGRMQILDEETLGKRGRAIAAGLARKAAAQAAIRPLAQTAASPGVAALSAPEVPPVGTASLEVPPVGTASPETPAALVAAEAPAGTASVPETAVPINPETPIATEAPAGTASVPETAVPTDRPPAEKAAAADRTAPPTTPGEEISRFWREDKIGLLMAMTSEPTEDDPCPEIPETFVDPLRIRQLARELRKGVPLAEEPAAPATDPQAEAEALTQTTAVWRPPQMQEKRVLASRRNWDSFGPMVAAAAWAMGLFAAGRRAFLGDGAETNWTVWRSFFSSFEPILDFIHALSYVYAAAHAGRSKTEGWKCYVTWIRWVWQGQVKQVLTALEARQAELGRPEAAAADSKARQVVDQAWTYLSNNQERMKYADYRRQGLPITSSYVESAVKQFNQRAKGTEKFWGDEGAEAILQLRGDHLSDDQPLAAFWQRRQQQATGQRSYRQAG